jgi:hypothetical protein
VVSCILSGEGAKGPAGKAHFTREVFSVPLSDEESGIFGLGQGCPLHGDEFLRECSMCGTEFCTKCYSPVSVCPNCSMEVGEADDDEEEEPDFEDVKDLDALLGKDEEVEKILNEEEDIPPEDLIGLDDSKEDPKSP